MDETYARRDAGKEAVAKMVAFLSDYGT